MTASTRAVPLRDDAATIGLIGLAHGTSHFFHLLLPPLFPLFIRDFGFSYSQLGFLVSVFFIVSGVGQALAGFLVDRIGARPVLFAALGCFVLAALVAAGATGYGGLMLAAALAGLGNSPFHPVDFTILNKRVSAKRLGHAFSAHGISGNLGWAAAPAFLTSVMALTGSWRYAAAGMGVWALLVIAVLWWKRDLIDDRIDIEAAAVGTSPNETPEHPLAFLRLPSVWLCFSFFFWATVMTGAMQSYAGPALHTMYDLPLTAAAWVVTGYMLCAAAGILVGGFVAAQSARLERAIAVCLLASAALMCVAASGVVPGSIAAAAAILAGFGTGLAGPSRDMLVKRAAPRGATGRVYGTVYSAFDLSFAITTPLIGAMLDHGMPQGVFLVSAISLAMAVVSASLVGMRIARPLAAGSAAA
jgi:MFS family permease